MQCRTICQLISAFCLFFSLSISAQLTVPTNLIALNTAKGQTLLNESHHKKDFIPLIEQFTTQQTMAYCAIASSVMVLNALHINAQIDRRYYPHPYMTQNNIFTKAVMKYRHPAYVNFRGVDLHTLQNILKTFGVSVKLIYASDLSENDFRQLAIKAMDSGKSFIIVNFYRKQLEEEGGGHMSPIAAYNKKADRFLLLDVARYKYPPVWVKTHALWLAMKTMDKSTKKSRGFLVIH